MKNIHVLPTEKSSSLYYKDDNYKLANSTMAIDWYISSAGYKPTNIYITSDEEIKEGDWCYQVELNDGKIDKCYDVTLYHTWTNNGVDKKIKYKKIILTTDQDLINDGVQAIDDEFLEWFVKNPSCESVVVNDSKVVKEHIFDGSNDGEIVWEKKIIIPQEDPKQETFEESVNAFKKTDVYINYIKQKQERMYSEEDLLSAFEAGMMFIGEDKGSFREWFEQFKKK
jgi:hypothetical protein